MVRLTLIAIDIDIYWHWLVSKDAFMIMCKLFHFLFISDETERNLAKIAVFNIISSAKLRLMDWALTSRAFSPKVYMLQEVNKAARIC